LKVGPDHQIGLACGGGNALIIDDRTGAPVREGVLTGLGGADEMWYNSGDNHYFFGISTPGLLGVADAGPPPSGAFFLAKLFADSAYAGSIFHTALTKVLPNLGTEIVKRSDRAKGFVPLPKRWIGERTIAWLNRCRRLAKDWENLNRNALAFLKLASIRLMLRKLCNP
jgi:transposase